MLYVKFTVILKNKTSDYFNVKELVFLDLGSFV